jgi:hypothetical protein
MHRAELVLGRRSVAATSALLLLLLLALVPSAASAATVRFDATVRAGAIDFEGEEFVFVGDVASRRLGAGAIVYSTRGDDVTGRRTAVMRIYTNRGRIDARVLSIFSTQADGSVRNDGVGIVTGGSGRYRGAVGYFDVFAQLDPAQPDKTTFFMRDGRITLAPARPPTPDRSR